MNVWGVLLLLAVLIVGGLLYFGVNPPGSPAPASWRCSTAIPCPAPTHAPAAAQR